MANLIIKIKFKISKIKIILIKIKIKIILNNKPVVKINIQI